MCIKNDYQHIERRNICIKNDYLRILFILYADNRFFIAIGKSCFPLHKNFNLSARFSHFKRKLTRVERHKNKDFLPFDPYINSNYPCLFPQSEYFFNFSFTK